MLNHLTMQHGHLFKVHRCYVLKSLLGFHTHRHTHKYILFLLEKIGKLPPFKITDLHFCASCNE
jgi:hypothetical protein